MSVLRQAQDERGNWSGLAVRLAAKAGKLGAAHSEARRRARRGDARRWRLARLLWPLWGEERE